jgi:Fur family peroxide stress response transcriptional regulator
MSDPEQRFEDLKAKFRHRGYRLTPQRVALLRLLSVSEGHPSAADLHERIQEQFPTTSLATVYKTLNLLKDMGEVLELGFGHDDNRYDGNKPYPHPHLICLRCRSILDLDVRLVESLERAAPELSEYEIVGHRVDFYAICPDCQGEE